jgi:phospholipase C
MSGVGDIDTVVVVMLENRSFDHVLGHLRHPSFGNRQDIEGLKDPATTTDYDNFFDSQVFKPFPMSDGVFLHDLPHDRSGIATQLSVINGQATMAGFAQAFVDKTGSVLAQPPPLGFLTPDAVPVSDFLASEYLVCNRWFAPLPAGTQANRSVAFTGSSLIDDNVKGIIPHDALVFDWLTRKKVRWRVYHSGLSFFLLFGQLEALGPNFRSIRRLAQDVQDEPLTQAPQVVFIEPEYDDSPVHLGFVPNDNHPPLPIGPGETFLHMVYTALTSNPARWAKTLLIVTYDEHGGFFDHVEPPGVRTQPPKKAKYKKRFLTAGVRVPAMIASPWVGRGRTNDATFDHTSILQLIAEKFAGSARKYSDEVNKRADQGISSLSEVLTASAPRHDLPLPPAAPIAATTLFRGGAKKTLSENQEAFARAARACLAADRGAALERFPELAMLPAQET